MRPITPSERKALWPTVPLIYKRDGEKRSTKRALREWLTFLQTPIGLTS